MITNNPFTELATSMPLITPEVMQGYVIAMFIIVVASTIWDVVHKKSAKYFALNAEKAAKSAKREVDSGERMSLAISTVTSEVLTSSEFSNQQRRMSHLLTMYGFIIFIVSTILMIFGDPASTTTPMFWHLGAAMVAVGGYWFWFIIRVDVSAEGNPWYKLGRADIFIVSLLATVTFALLWSFMQNNILFLLFIASSTTLFSTVLWSKFAHMFFKPAAAYQKKITKADGSQENLPDLGVLTDPELQARYPDIPEYMGKNPPNMGLGIKREAPHHY